MIIFRKSGKIVDTILDTELQSKIEKRTESESDISRLVKEFNKQSQI